LRINYIELLQSYHANQSIEKDEIEIPELYKEIKSLKNQLLEIQEHLYSNIGRGG
jgi:uncharacterized coiled-coil DUF342 family protein